MSNTRLCVRVADQPDSCVEGTVVVRCHHCDHECHYDPSVPGSPGETIACTRCLARILGL